MYKLVITLQNFINAPQIAGLDTYYLLGSIVPNLSDAHLLAMAENLIYDARHQSSTVLYQTYIWPVSYHLNILGKYE